MFDRKGKRFPHFTAYLEAAKPVASPPIDRRAVVAGVVIMPAIIALGILISITAAVPILLFAGLLLAPVFTVGTIWLVHNRFSRKPTQREIEFRASIQAFQQVSKERKLHKNVDPAAIQLLEAAAYHYDRVQTTLAGADWSSPDLPLHWAAIRANAQQAAEETMTELLILCKPCIGKPNKDKKKQLEDVLEDLFDLDVADALQGLKSLSSTNWEDYAHRSPAGRIALHEGRVLAERLQSLADELEQTSPAPLGQGAGASSSVRDALDGVLGELRAVREAEAELEQRQ